MPRYAVALDREPVPFQWIVFNLCSHDDSGDYEAIPDHELSLDLSALESRLLSAGFEIEGLNAELCLARREQLFITLYPNGRTLLEGIRPDSPDGVLPILSAVLPLTLLPST